MPLLEALLGADTCFNQRTGAALKWYVEDPNGQITLFDSPGFDPVSRVEKRPVTPDVCRAFAEEKNKQQPRRIKASLKDIEFFDPNTGRPKVWYSKGSDGSYALYDRSGFDPVTGGPLQPVTKDVVAALVAADLAGQQAQEATARKKAEAAAAEKARRQAEAKQLPCPGKLEGPEAAPLDWTTFNRHHCDVGLAVSAGAILLDGPGLSKPLHVAAGDYTLPKSSYMIYTRVKADTAGAQWWHIECDPGHWIIGKFKCRP